MDNEIVYWTMKDGRKVSVDDMDINHLRNALKMLIKATRAKSKPVGRHWFEFKKDKTKSNHDKMMDSYLNDEEFNEPEGWGY